MATKKSGGSTSNGRDSPGKHLQVYKFGGEKVTVGVMIVTQRGTKFYPGRNAFSGRTHSVHAATDGYVSFRKGYKGRTFVDVLQTKAD
ncbi:50S ribosomal protein L27 [Anaplasmataceae bacterium AB001_6]|nr:50S ribosomal protein L27 [Anaplasmataceae bacterium AB001_6]